MAEVRRFRQDILKDIGFIFIFFFKKEKEEHVLFAEDVVKGMIFILNPNPTILTF